MSNQDLETQVIALLKEGKAITAVRLVQEELQCGLKVAKDYVDKLINEM
jgi:ribosomal protein L7/L12